MRPPIDMILQGLPEGISHRTTRMSVILAACVTLLLTFGPMAVAVAHDPLAPPSPEKQVDACKQQVAAQAPTIDVPHQIWGAGLIGGCVVDPSGIDHMYVSYESSSGSKGRICTDPTVKNGAWNCSWNTTFLPTGHYIVRLIAFDVAGNQGSSYRRYEVIPPPVAPQSGTSTSTDSGKPTSSKPPSADRVQGNPSGNNEVGTNASHSSEAPGPATATPPEPASTQVAPDTSQSTDTGAAAPPIGTGPPAGPPGLSLSPIEQLVLTQLDSCAQQQKAADLADLTTPADAAEATLKCSEPVLAQLGTVVVFVDDEPGPKLVRVAFTNPDVLERARLVLPSHIADVPLELALLADLPPRQATLAAAALDVATGVDTPQP